MDLQTKTVLGRAPSRPAAFEASPIPARAGVGLKPQHVSDIIATHASIGWFEVHAENYMGHGGLPHRQLEAIRDRYPLSLHGVGLSIGSPDPLDRAHLERLRELERRYRPGLFSEHLAWSSHEGTYLNDLLPLPLNRATLSDVIAHVDEVQQVLGRQMLLENPSTYLMFDETDIPEPEFLTQVVDATECGLLLDVNNVWVSSVNHRFDADAYIEVFPCEHVGEIHLGGHARDQDEHGETLLIDSHGEPVDEAVWSLYARTLQRTGPRPVLVEWDNDVPDWATLLAEAVRAEAQIAVEQPARDQPAVACARG